MVMSKIIFNIVLVVIAVLIVCTAWPFISRAQINYELKKEAIYGTKHSVGETRQLLTKALKEKGVNYDPDDLEITKDARDKVTISLDYEDSIHFFSIVLKKLEFKLNVKQKNVKEVF